MTSRKHLKLNRKTRKILTSMDQHDIRAETDRSYIPRKEGGR
jgi:hypothetical protein